MKTIPLMLIVASLGLSACMPEINYGNNSSQWAFDGECDDPRFYGPGMADTLLEEDMGRDASDCRNAMNAGLIAPR